MNSSVAVQHVGERSEASDTSANKLSWFVLSAGIILAITGAAKVFSALSDTRALGAHDPIFGISLRSLMLLVGPVEMAIAFLCLFTNKSRMSTVLIAWIATSFLVYRSGLWFVDWHGPCRCLGNLTDALHISPSTADLVMKILLAYMIIGSYFILLREWMTGDQERADRLPGEQQSVKAER